MRVMLKKGLVQRILGKVGVVLAAELQQTVALAQQAENATQ